MSAEGKELVGPIIGVVGATLLFIGGLLGIGLQSIIQAELDSLGIIWTDIGITPLIFTIRTIVTLSLAILGVVGAILGFIGKRLPGGILMLLAGINASAGMFIILGIINTGTLIVIVSLVYTFVFIDPFLILLGGILGLALRTEE